MDFRTARALYKAINSSKLADLRQGLLESGVRYARLRTDWQLSSTAKRGELERPRTLAHNRFIDTCNILSRNMANNQEDVSWRETLGTDRKEIWDFACHLHCILGLAAR